MLRIGFFLSLDKRWMGGVNYYRNFLTAIHENLEEDIHPVVFLISVNNNLTDGFPPVEFIKDSCFERFRVRWFIRKINERVINKNYILERLLLKNDIDLLSHSSYHGELHPCPTVATARLPVLGWIPDFQHLHLPDFFSQKEIRLRNRGFKEVCEKSSTIIVSSKSAQKDLAIFAPEYYHKSRVLQFVVKPLDILYLVGLSELQKQYQFKGPYFHLPNQFWVHKNHFIVINALKILKSMNRKITIIVTGNKKDNRNEGYYDQLLKDVKESGLSESFRILGLVPYQHMVSLMYHSIAVINPSFFEGWSTTVEEAKSYGKRIILSNINVHREQNPESAVYFDPNNAEELAALLWNDWASYDLDNDKNLRQEAAEKFPGRWKEFAEKYLTIVTDSKFNVESSRDLQAIDV